MKILLEVHTIELPYQWVRERGSKVRYKHPSLRAWQEYLVDLAKQEIAMAPDPSIFPYKGEMEYSFTISFPSVEALRRAPDGKNILSGIEDAFNKVVWRDDGPKYVLAGQWRYQVAATEALIGTHLIVYSLL